MEVITSNTDDISRWNEEWDKRAQGAPDMALRVRIWDEQLAQESILGRVDPRRECKRQEALLACIDIGALWWFESLPKRCVGHSKLATRTLDVLHLLPAEVKMSEGWKCCYLAVSRLFKDRFSPSVERVICEKQLNPLINFGYNFLWQGQNLLKVNYASYFKQQMICASQGATLLRQAGVLDEIGILLPNSSAWRSLDAALLCHASTYNIPEACGAIVAEVIYEQVHDAIARGDLERALWQLVPVTYGSNRAFWEQVFVDRSLQELLDEEPLFQKNKNTPLYSFVVGMIYMRKGQYLLAQRYLSKLFSPDSLHFFGPLLLEKQALWAFYMVLQGLGLSEECAKYRVHIQQFLKRHYDALDLGYGLWQCSIRKICESAKKEGIDDGGLSQFMEHSLDEDVPEIVPREGLIGGESVESQTITEGLVGLEFCTAAGDLWDRLYVLEEEEVSDHDSSDSDSSDIDSEE